MDTCSKHFVHSTPDENYCIFIWEEIRCEYMDDSEFIEDVSAIRHSIASIDSDLGEYSPIHFDARSQDSEGCDEEFEYMFGWNAYIHFEPGNYDIA